MIIDSHCHLNMKEFNNSLDKTIKYSFQLHDKLLVEGVLIPSLKRLTACISSQVGCSLACEFCATGTLKLERNLTAAEIYDQVYMLNEEAISNFNQAVRYKYKNAHLFILRGLAKNNVGKNKTAISDFTKALSLDKKKIVIESCR